MALLIDNAITNATYATKINNIRHRMDDGNHAGLDCHWIEYGNYNAQKGPPRAPAQKGPPRAPARKGPPRAPAPDETVINKRIGDWIEADGQRQLFENLGELEPTAKQLYNRITDQLSNPNKAALATLLKEINGILEKVND